MNYKIIFAVLIVAILLFGCAGFGGQKSDDKKDTQPVPAPTPQPTPTPPSSDDDYPPSLPDE